MYALENLERQTPARLLYWGGFFDEALNMRIKRVNGIYTPALEINRSKSIQETLQQVFPGKLIPYTKNGYPQTELLIQAALPAFSFIRQIRPYMEYRKAQAAVMENFLLKKREVRREIEGLLVVPQTPSEERIAFEEDSYQQLLIAKRETSQNPHLAVQARLAGILDASATFGIDSKTHELYPNFLPHIVLNSVHKGLLDGLYQTYGGTKPRQMHEGESGYSKGTYEWQISSETMTPLLQIIEPHLIFKHAQVELILDFLKIKPILTVRSSDPLVQSQRLAVLQSYVDNMHQLIAA